MTKIIVDRYRQRPPNEYDIKRTYSPTKISSYDYQKKKNIKLHIKLKSYMR